MRWRKQFGCHIQLDNLISKMTNLYPFFLLFLCSVFSSHSKLENKMILKKTFCKFDTEKESFFIYEPMSKLEYFPLLSVFAVGWPDFLIFKGQIFSFKSKILQKYPVGDAGNSKGLENLHDFKINWKNLKSKETFVKICNFPHLPRSFKSGNPNFPNISF